MRRIVTNLRRIGSHIRSSSPKLPENPPYEIPKMVYIILAPDAFKPNSNYQVYVELPQSDENEPLEVKVEIVGKSYSDSKTITVQPLKSQLIEFKIPELKEGDYDLTVKGISGISFEHKRKLTFFIEKNIILVQTDKATYKPEDLVRFRVLILDKHTRPMDLVAPVNVFIEDPEQDRVRQFIDVHLTNGVFSEELQLPEFPNLGTWNILVESGEVKEKKSFEVEKYVLPKFEVKINTKEHFCMADKKVVFDIHALYTYGKPVDGEAIVTVQMQCCRCHVRDFPKLEKIATLRNGKATITLDIKNDLKCEHDRCLHFVNAIVKEKLSGIEYNSFTYIIIHKDCCEVKSVSCPDFYNENVPFEVVVALENHDGSPVIDDKNPVEIFLKKSKMFNPGNPNTAEREFGKQCMLDENGIARTEFLIPSTEDGLMQNDFEIYIKYLDLERETASIINFAGYIGKIYEPVVKIETDIESASLDENIELKIRTTVDMKYFYYKIVGRVVDIINSGFITITDESKREYILKIKPTLEMVPSAFIFLYFVHEYELFSCVREIKFQQSFKNHIQIQVTPDRVGPGENVNITINSEPNSFVGLLGIDKSVLLLKSGNDISIEDIFQKLSKYKVEVKLDNPDYYYATPARELGIITLSNAKHFNRKVYRARFYCSGKIRSCSGIIPSLKTDNSISPKRHLPEKTTYIRKNFVETWVWENLENIGNTGQVTINRKIPDTMTSWVLSGISISPKYGIGITPFPTNVEVFQPFFISTNLPYSIIRGEITEIPVIISNYQNMDTEVKLTFDNSDGNFDFIDSNDDECTDGKRTTIFTVGKNSGISKSFLICPKRVGRIPLKLFAISSTANDAIEQKLLVEPEGVTKYVNKSFLINFEHHQEENKEIMIDVPNQMVEDSMYAKISAVGDLLGPTIQNLDQLVRLPYGCGEQNIIIFVPNVLVLQYLQKTDQLTTDIEERAKSFLKIGYQRELNFKHRDGSYSAFGKHDKFGSTWLTAYVIKSFAQATELTHIDGKTIDEGLKYLASKQVLNGSFKEVGKLYDFTFPSTPLFLTAYVTLTFLECQETFSKYNGVIKKALNFLAKSLNNKTEIFDHVIITYALQKGGHGKKKEAVERLICLSTKEGDHQWWSQGKKEDEKNQTVEITAYALLTLLENDAGEEIMPIVKWLISKRNSRGGFDSTQATVVGLSALIKFAEKFSLKGSTPNLEISFNADTNMGGNFLTSKENSLLLQTYIFNSPPNVIAVNIKGSGSSLIQVSYKYNIVETEQRPRFNIKSTIEDSSTLQNLKLSISTSFIPAENEKFSNMAVMEVNLPSGFTADEDNLKTLKEVNPIKMVETKNGNTVVIIYFNNLDDTEVSAVILGMRAHHVFKQKPVPILVYDYYDKSRRASVFYELPKKISEANPFEEVL